MHPRPCCGYRTLPGRGNYDLCPVCWWEQRRVAEEIARNPEGSMKDFNAAVRALRAEATALSHRQVKTRLREVVRAHDMPFASAHLELFSRQSKDEGFYRGHPVRTGWWLLRYSQPGTFKRRWREVRTGTIHFTTVSK